MERAFDEIASIFNSAWKLFCLIMLGLIGKFSIDVITGRRITLLQAFASAGIAVFVGVVANFMCEYNELQRQSNFIVPVATLMSDKLITAIMALNVKKIVHEWLKYWVNKTKK